MLNGTKKGRKESREEKAKIVTRRHKSLLFGVSFLPYTQFVAATVGLEYEGWHKKREINGPECNCAKNKTCGAACTNLLLSFSV